MTEFGQFGDENYICSHECFICMKDPKLIKNTPNGLCLQLTSTIQDAEESEQGFQNIRLTPFPHHEISA